MILWRNGFENGDYGISRDPNGLYGTQKVFGKASFPPNPLKKQVFPTFPGFREIWGGSPWPPVDLLLALCGPVSYPTPEQPPEWPVCDIPQAVIRAVREG